MTGHNMFKTEEWKNLERKEKLVSQLFLNMEKRLRLIEDLGVGHARNEGGEELQEEWDVLLKELEGD